MHALAFEQGGFVRGEHAGSTRMFSTSEMTLALVILEQKTKGKFVARDLHSFCEECIIALKTEFVVPLSWCSIHSMRLLP